AKRRLPPLPRPPQPLLPALPRPGWPLLNPLSCLPGRCAPATPSTHHYFGLDHRQPRDTSNMNDQITVAPIATASPIAESASWGTELRATFNLAWPLVIAQLAQNALNTTNVILLGWLGPGYLAAGILATAFYMPFMVAATG